MLNPRKLAPIAAVLIGTLGAAGASATTQVVTFNQLNASATLAVPFLAGDVLRLNTYATQVGALLQTITFTLGADVGMLSGQASWEINTATGIGPRLIGVNVDVFDAANALVISDSSVLTGNGFATSSFATTALGAGTYHMVATGTGVRDSSLDVTLKFASAVPEPGSFAMILAGLSVVLLLARRRKV
jgi:PEP-CTERM motif